ncbi:MAG: PepSY domain-containing protein [Granulosicoccus sp.]|nr:PepSY domain-containing protein [Granulosicoccus sp.]
MKAISVTGLTAAAALLIASPLLASNDDDELANLESAITIEAAVASATASVEGRVLEAELESEDGQLVWEIEILAADETVNEVMIDAITGALISIELDD